MREKHQVGIGRNNHGDGEVVGGDIGSAHEGVEGEKLREEGARVMGLDDGVPEEGVFGRRREGVEDGGRGSRMVVVE